MCTQDIMPTSSTCAPVVVVAHQCNSPELCLFDVKFAVLDLVSIKYFHVARMCFAVIQTPWSLLTFLFPKRSPFAFNEFPAACFCP